MPKSNITTAPLTTFSLLAARLSVACTGLFFVLFVALHFLEPEFEPSWRFISEYQLGPYGWMMSAAFLSLMVGAASLLLAVQSQIRTVGGYIGLFLLLLSTIGFGLAGAFISDSILATAATTHGKLHSVGALLGSNVSGAAYFLGWSLARNTAWRSQRRRLLLVTGLAILGNLAAFWMQGVMGQAAGKFGPTVLVGWPNRLLIAMYVAWIAALAWLIVRKATAQGAEDG